MQQRTAIFQPSGRDRQLHVSFQIAAAAGIERRVGGAERTGLRQCWQRPRFEIAVELQPVLHRFRQHEHIGRQAGDRMIVAADARVNRTDRRTGGVAGAHHFAVRVAAVTRSVRPHDRDAIGQRRQLRKRATESDAGQLRGHFTGDAANLAGGGHLRIEEFDVRRAALQKQQHDRPVFQHARRERGRGLGSQQTGERQRAQAQ